MRNFRKFQVGDVTRKCAAIIDEYIDRPVSGVDSVRVSDSVDPCTYGRSDVDRFRSDWLSVSLLSKYPDLDLPIDKRSAALESFIASEKSCTETNTRLLSPCPLWGVEAVIHTARRKITELLGRVPLSEISSDFGFSNGASTRLPRVGSASPNKFSVSKDRLHVTPACYPYARAAVLSAPRWVELLTAQTGSLEPCDWFKLVPGNCVTTVPKNAKTDRVIAKEPCMNMFVQRGIGSVIRRRLKHVGVNLDDQTLNQKLARVGSIDGSLATLDLRAASDSISMELVNVLLPDDWCQILFDARSCFGVLPDGALIRYQKVSSMGNGFTFELESLIFWALLVSTLECYGHSDRRFAVYGDDLVLSVSAAADLTSVLSYCGFDLNPEKSFTYGYFRESCGKHYFSGYDVTPFYIRKCINNVFRLFWLVNSWRRWSTSHQCYGSQPEFKVWRKLRQFIPKRWWKLTIPDGVGDGGILSTLAEAKPRYAGSCYIGVRMSGVQTQFTPGDTLMYLDRSARNSARNSNEGYVGPSGSSARSIVVKERYDPFESIKLEKGVPDLYRIHRYKLAVWHDPAPYITGV